MSTLPYTYPFDSSGALASNLIDGERQVISPPDWRDYYVLIPQAAPFFRDSMRVIHHPSGRTLTEGVDYYCTHRFHDASLAIGKEICGSVTFLDRTIAGVADLRYQTVGGEWTLNEQQIEEILAEELANPRITTWEMIAQLPREFPVIDHEWDLVDMVGASDLLPKLDGIAQAIRDQTAGAGESHVNDLNNPHQVTAAQVGLGQVANHPMASGAEALAGTSAERYMSPVRTREAILALVGNDFAAHAANKNNPHETNKTHVGLGSVENHPMATSEEAIAGTSAERYMSPITTDAVIQARFNANTVPHLNNRNNPHEVTAAQIGLSLVQNFGVATQAQAVTGAANNVYMTPLRTREAIEALFGDTLINHINDKSNPHEVTKAHVGLDKVINLALATVDAARAGVDDSGYMTPRLVAEAIYALGGGGGGTGGTIDSEHRLMQNNPHNTTAAQVGAYSKNESDALLAGKLGINGTAANSDRLGGLSSAEVLRKAQVRFEWPAVSPREIDDGAGGTVMVNQGVTWTSLGSYVPQGVVDATVPVADMVFYLTGGDSRESADTPVYLVKLNIFGETQLRVDQIAGAIVDMQVGYVRDPSTQAITLYVRSPASRTQLSMLVMSDPTGGLGTVQNPLDFEPLNIVYAQTFRYRAEELSATAAPGELAFGANPHGMPEDDFGGVVEFANVVELPEDIMTAQITEAELRDDYHDFIPGSMFGSKSRHAVKADLIGWDWLTPGLIHRPVGSTMCSLMAPNNLSKYTVEVEVGANSDTDMAVGVCAAYVRKNGKDHGIYVLRSPGGLVLASEAGDVPGGDFYKLLTVGYNLCQDDAIDLGSTNAGLNWGDQEPDENRGVVGPYVSAPETGWNAVGNGSCRIKVIRNGDIIIIQTSELGSSDVTTGTSVVVDLNSLPELAVFKGPTSWGLVKYGQGDATFEVITRPDYYRPYIVYAKDADGRDTSTYNRYDGAVWLNQPMALTQSFTKPCRLYYSDLNARLFYSRRDGTLKPLNIEAYTTENVTVLTS